MALKINSADQRIFNRHKETLRAKHSDLIGSMEVFNAQMAALFEQVQSALDDLNAAKAEAVGFVDDIHRVFEEDIDGRSETWQDSERGQAARAWLEEIEGVAAVLNWETEVLVPADLDLDVEDDSEAIDNLLFEPEQA